MNNLNIDFGSCVKASSKLSNCTKCEDICPKKSISFYENIPKADESCIDCGGCIGVCPTEAISLEEFNTIDFIFSFLENNENLISCKKNTPCLSFLSVENMISLALLSENTVLDLGHCANCDIRDPLFSNIQNNIKKANFFLASIQSEKRIIGENIAYEDSDKKPKNRRDFLKSFTLKHAIKNKIKFDDAVEDEIPSISIQDSQNIKNKEIPNKRKLLFMALKRVDKVSDFIFLEEEEITFASMKYIDDSCDNCSICYRVCPTKALSSNKRSTVIDFDPLLCVKCTLCHDVCEKNSIHLASFSTKEIFNPKVHNLANFDVVRCDECANYFTYLGGEKTCPRCKIEEEEAKSLWGIQ